MERTARNRTLTLPFHLILTLLSVLLSSAFAIIMCIQLHQIASAHLTAHYQQLDQSQFTQCTSIASHELSSIEAVGNLASSDANLRLALEGYQPLSYRSSNHLRKSLNAIAFTAKAMFPGFQNMVVLGEDCRYQSLSASTQPDDQAEFLALFPDCEASFYFHLPEAVSSSSLFLRGLEQTVFLSYPIRTENGKLFHLLIIADPGYFAELFRDYERVALISGDSQILLNTTTYPDEALLSADAASDTIQKTEIREGFSLAYQKNSLPLVRENKRITALLVLCVAAVSVASFVFSFFVARPLTAPLKELTQKLTEPTFQKQDDPEPVHFLSPFWRLFLFFFSITMTLSILIAVLFSVYFEKQTREDFQISLRESTSQVLVPVEAFFENIRKTTYSLSLSSELQDSFRDASAENREALRAILDQAQNLYSVPVSLCLFDNSGDILATTNPTLYHESAALREADAALPQWDAESRKQSYFLIYQSSLRSVNNLQKLGYLSVKINESVLTKSLSSLYPNSCSAYVHFKDGRILSAINENEIGLQVPSASSGFRFTMNIADTELYLTFLIDSQNLKMYQQESLRSCVYLIIIVAFSILGLSFIISFYFSNSLKTLNATLQISPTQYSTVSRKSSNILEFDQLYQNYYQMTQRIQELLEQVAYSEWQQYQLELLRQRTDLLLLQSQINPHFLYNTFEAICHMIYIGDRDNSITMLNRLTDMFRFASKNDLQFVTLREELIYLENYLQIMQVRYPDALSFSFHVAPEAYRVKIVKFVLQPIVENSIIHGFSPRDGHGIISLNAVRMHDRLLITIRDNGVGMDAEKLAALRESMTGEDIPNSIGLPNISKRLQLAFGREDSLQITSVPDSGTVVSIIIPAEELQESADAGDPV